MEFFSEYNSGKTCSRAIIFDCHKRFWSGRAEISEDFRSDRFVIPWTELSTFKSQLEVQSSRKEKN